MNTRVHVAVGVIFSPDKKKVLITKRSAHQHLAGLWEFPGGKVEKDEDVETALERELDEELGIKVKKAKHLISVYHDYTDKKVLLNVWQIEAWSGEPHGMEGQGLAWVKVEDLNLYNFPEANQHIIQTLSLSSVYLISHESYENHSQFLATVENYFSKGLKLFQLRLSEKNEPEYSEIIEKLSKSASKYHAKLIINGTPGELKKFNVNGIHLKSKDLFNYNERPIGAEYILGASCHNENELIQAQKLNVNYAFLSPVKKTKSHPEKEALGWDKFCALSKKVNYPIYALGGMSIADIELAISNYAFGIAMISAGWDNPKIYSDYFSTT